VSDTKRCILCGRAKGDLVDPYDSTSRRVILTREHIFRESWEGSAIDISYVPDDHPLSTRSFTSYRVDGSIRSVRPDPLFQLVVKPVCDYCNNGWMNDLDSVVEPWVFDPYADESQCDPVQFRRWATKAAVLRSYYEDPIVPQPGDLKALYEGVDITGWRIFVGRLALPSHSHQFVGFGVNDMQQGGRAFGITEVSWSLGHTLFIALRLADDELAPPWFKTFKRVNMQAGVLVAEVLPTATSLPSLATLPNLSLRQEASLTWFFSTVPVSPIAEQVRVMERGFRRAIEETGGTVEEAY
jgi:hypothetical protein